MKEEFRIQNSAGLSGYWLVVFCMVFILFGELGPVFALEPPTPPPPGEPMAGLGPASVPIEKSTPGMYRIGDLTIDRNTQSISFPAVVNMDKGLLEYLIVQARGKTHESLLRTKIEPYHLQIAFLLLGFEGANRPLRFQGDPEKPKGEALEITLSHQKPDGQITTVKAEEWVAKGTEASHGPVGSLEWVYTGSLVMEGRFLAQMEGSIAAIFHDPAAMIDNSSAGGESDTSWFVKDGVVPPVGTPVTVLMRKKLKAPEVR